MGQVDANLQALSDLREVAARIRIGEQRELARRSVADSRDLANELFVRVGVDRNRRRGADLQVAYIGLLDVCPDPHGIRVVQHQNSLAAADILSGINEEFIDDAWDRALDVVIRQRQRQHVEAHLSFLDFVAFGHAAILENIQLAVSDFGLLKRGLCGQHFCV